MKKLEGHTKIKTAIEITKFAPENGLNRCSKSVDAVAFDGHFGVHRVLLASVEPARQVKLKGRPMKLMYEYERSCQCKKKMPFVKSCPIARLDGSLHWTL